MELTTLCNDSKSFCKFISTKALTVDGKFFYFRDNSITISLSLFEKCVDIRITKYIKMGFFDIPSEYRNIQYDMDSNEGKILKGYLDFTKFVKS